MTMTNASGPLLGLRVIEFAGIGPSPFACMLLSDMGADVVTLGRPGMQLGARYNLTGRGRSIVLADLKDTSGRETALELIAKADVLIEGFRPGVMERLGLGPEDAFARNARIVYGRMTGWGQHGPLALAAGHDLNYISVTGALHAIGPRDGPPVPPLNLVGDYGAGSLYLISGVLAALHESRTSGKGQVVDAAMSDGVVSLMTTAMSLQLLGTSNEKRGSNLLDGGAPYYCVYETADGEHVALAAIEPKFFAVLCDAIGLPPELRGAQNEQMKWPLLRDTLARIFRTKTLDEWTRLVEGIDACLTPVLPLSQAQAHPHNVARKAFVEVAGINQPAPAPRFSRTPSRIQGPAPTEATPTDRILARWS